MRVLFLTQVLPYPPDSGPKIKTWNVLKYLSRHHEVTLVSFVRGDQSADVEHLRRYCQAVHTVLIKRSLIHDGIAMLHSLVTGKPWIMVRDERATMHQLVDRLAAEISFDFVHADQLNMAQYAARVTNARKVLDTHNALWLLYKRLAATMSSGLRRWLLERDWRLLRAYEGQLVRDFDVVLAVSEEDKIALLEAAGCLRDVKVIPIAIDTEEIAPITRSDGADQLLHIGTMYWPPNIDGVLWFCQEVWPLIQAQRPNTVFNILGARPPKAILDLEQPRSGITVTGYVTDPQPYLKQTGVMVVPIRAGGGMRVKILNALAQGLPIVSTRLGCEGIAVTDGVDILIADTPEELAMAVLHVLGDLQLAQRLSMNARKLAVENYNYRVTCAPLDDIYHQL